MEQEPLRVPDEPIAAPLPEHQKEQYMKAQYRSQTWFGLLVIFLLILLFGVAIVRTFQKLAQSFKRVPSSVTVHVTPTPVALTPSSAVATTSAYLDFEQAVQNLSSLIETSVAQDPSLAPPNIEFELGLSP